MATIEKITGKTGTAYRISVSAGFDTNGKRIRHRTMWKPTPGMTPRQIEKAVQRAFNKRSPMTRAGGRQGTECSGHQCPGNLLPPRPGHW